MTIIAPPGDAIIRLPAVAQLLGVSASSIERMVSRGDFPPGMALTTSARPRRGWLRSTVLAHRDRLAAEASQRSAPPAASNDDSPHIVLAAPTRDRSEYIVRRLGRYGFRPLSVAPAGDGAGFIVRVNAERNSVAGTLETLRVCAADVLSEYPPRVVDPAVPGDAAVLP